jgi:hypothetical protein
MIAHVPVLAHTHKNMWKGYTSNLNIQIYKPCMKMGLGPTTPMKSGKAQDFFLLSFSLLSRIRSSVYAVIVILILVRVLY